MRKKQFLALLLAGTLTVSMAPVAFVQAEAIEEAGVASEMAEEIPAAEEPSQAETPAEEPGEASPEETPAETQPSEETAAGGPSGEAAETQPAGSPETADAFIEAGEAEVSPADGEEDTPKVYILSDGIMTEQASLADAIANAGDISGEIASDTQPTQIVVTGTVELTAPVVIQNKYISISAGETGAEIRRSGFEGDMFTVEANSALEFALTRSGEEESADVYGLTVSGDSGAVSAGSIVAVKAGGYLGIAQAVTLTGNYSSVNGSAIRNEGGKVALFGGNISGNRTSAANGAAVYNTGELDLIGTVYVADNASDAEGQEDANVLLSGENAKIVLLGGLSSSKVLFTADSALVDK